MASIQAHVDTKHACLSPIQPHREVYQASFPPAIACLWRVAS